MQQRNVANVGISDFGRTNQSRHFAVTPRHDVARVFRCQDRGYVMNKAREKALREQRFEFREWKLWRRERIGVLLTGEHAEAVRALLTFCKNMTGATALIEHVKSGPWRDADKGVRAEILSLVSTIIIKRREQLGKAPFDDPLPDATPNTFLILRAWLTTETNS